MLEANFGTGALLKKLIDSLKDLVTEANFDCSPGGMSIQAMDSSHVALVNLLITAEGFHEFQCERNSIIGLNLASLGKVLKIVESNDTLILRHEEDADVVVVATESNKGAKSCEYTMKLMEIEAEALGIPEIEYESYVTLSSTEFAKICRDMAVFGDTVTITVDENGVKFSATGDIGEGYAFLKVSNAADKIKPEAVVKKEPETTPAEKPVVKKEPETTPAPTDENKVKDEVKTEVKAEIKAEPKDDDDDVLLVGQRPAGEVATQEKADDASKKSENSSKKTVDEDDLPLAAKFAPVKQETTETDKQIEKQQPTEVGVEVHVSEPLQLSFALRYFSTFSKASNLSDRVTLHFTQQNPCMIEFKLDGMGFLRFYLAPKVDEGEN